MKNTKILFKISLFCMSFAFVQAEVLISEGTRKFAQTNAAKIAQQFVSQYSSSDMITAEDLSKILQEDVKNLFSANGLQYVLGFIQAEIDQGSAGFASLPKIAKDQKAPVDNIRLWVQKNQGKIVGYLNENNVRKAGFKGIEEACKALKIKLPQGDLSDQEKKDIAEEITAAIHLANPDANKSFGDKYFSKKQYEYIADYLLPKLFAAGYSSLSVQDFENFLENLPKKSHTGVSVENTFAKLAQHRKKDFVNVLSDTLMTQRSLFKIIDVVKALNDHMLAEDNAR